MSDIQPGFASGIHNQEGLGIPHLRPMNVDRDGKLDLSVVKYVSPDNALRIRAGDVLFNNTNSAELIGKTAHIAIDTELAFSNHMTRLRPGVGVDYRFVAYQLHFLWMTGYFLHRCTHHVNQASISSKTLADTVPLVIAPSLEQIRIVEEIEKQFTRLDAAVGALKRVQANLKRYRAAVLKAACEGRLVPTEAELARRENRSYEPASVLLERILAERRIGSKAPRIPKIPSAVSEPVIDRLPGIPEGWRWVTLPQLGELNRGKSKHRPRDDAKLYGGKYPFIQTGDVRRSGGSIREYTQTYNEFGLSQSRLWPTGTLCITIAANIAESGILTFDACFPDSIVGFNCQGHGTTVKFVRYFLETAKANLSRFAPATAQKNINLEILSDLAVPLPPEAEQPRIEFEVDRRLSILDQVEAEVESDLLRANRLRQSVLREAFEGALIPQDPSDEPASALLSRIALEKTAKGSVFAHGPERKGAAPPMARNKRKERVSIIDALRRAKSEMPPEELLAATGHEADSIDDFYAELKSQVEAGLVEESRSGGKISLRLSSK
jgi:type I restriction enzyme, S subunit